MGFDSYVSNIVAVMANYMKMMPFIFSLICMCWRGDKEEDPTQIQDIWMPKNVRAA